jgi:hypothetical protein
MAERARLINGGPTRVVADSAQLEGGVVMQAGGIAKAKLNTATRTLLLNHTRNW